MADVLGSLMIELSTNLARFEGEMRSASNIATQAMRKIDTEVSQVKKVLAGLGVGFGVSEIVSFARGAVEAVGALDDLAEQTSLSVEFLDKLQQVATRGGIAFDTVAKAAGKFSENVAKARGGDEGLLTLFKNLGVSAQELKTLGIDELFQRVSSRIANASDSANANAYATALMGKAARDLAPLLNDIRDKGLGFARVNSQMAAAADEASKALNESKVRFEGLKLAVGVELSERFNALSRAFDAAKRSGDSLAGTLAVVFRAIVYGGDLNEAQKRFRDTSNEIVQLDARLKLLQKNREQRGDQPSIVETELEKRLNTLKRRRDQAVQDINRLTEPEPPKPKKEELPPPPDAGAGAAAKAAAEKAAAERKRLLELGSRETAKYVEELQRQFDEVVYTWDETGQQRIEIDKRVYDQQIKQAERAASELSRIQREQNARIAAEVEAGLDGTTSAAITRDRLRDEMSDIEQEARRGAQAAQELGLTFSSAFEDAIAGGKGLSDILQGIERDIIKLVTRKLVTEPFIGAFDTVFGSGKGAGAEGFQGVVEKGLGFLKDLIPKFAEGTPYVQRTGLAIVHQGERIVPAAQNRAGGAGGGINITINASGGMDRRSAQQLAAETGRAVARAQRRNG
jgi:hypothetical protein